MEAARPSKVVFVSVTAGADESVLASAPPPAPPMAPPPEPPPPLTALPAVPAAVEFMPCPLCCCCPPAIGGPPMAVSASRFVCGARLSIRCACWGFLLAVALFALSRIPCKHVTERSEEKIKSVGSNNYKSTVELLLYTAIKISFLIFYVAMLLSILYVELLWLLYKICLKRNM